MSNRAGRRSFGRREIQRLVRAKRLEIVSLYEKGYSVETIAARVGFSVEDARDLVAMVDEIHAEKEAS